MNYALVLTPPIVPWEFPVPVPEGLSRTTRAARGALVKGPVLLLEGVTTREEAAAVTKSTDPPPLSPPREERLPPEDLRTVSNWNLRPVTPGLAVVFPPRAPLLPLPFRPAKAIPSPLKVADENPRRTSTLPLPNHRESGSRTSPSPPLSTIREPPSSGTSFRVRRAATWSVPVTDLLVSKAAREPESSWNPPRSTRKTAELKPRSKVRENGGSTTSPRELFPFTFQEVRRAREVSLARRVPRDSQAQKGTAAETVFKERPASRALRDTCS